MWTQQRHGLVVNSKNNCKKNTLVCPTYPFEWTRFFNDDLTFNTLFKLNAAYSNVLPRHTLCWNFGLLISLVEEISRFFQKGPILKISKCQDFLTMFFCPIWQQDSLIINISGRKQPLSQIFCIDMFTKER